ncbi:MAG: quinol:cytochrome C oxidoreductase [Candidatus Ornithobacterium hominis]|nr:quinol:cytochrome C oxidoreductase [Candidatus Ornithobacterium hominis]
MSMFFLAIQHVSQSGWSVVVTRIMEGMTAFLPIGSVFILIVLIASALHFNHMYHWMDTELIDFNSDKFDHFMRTKSGWLNVPFWLTRSVIYLAGWTFFAWMLRKKSKRLDETGQVKDYWTLYKWGVFTIIFFALTSMSSGWDWIMSIDPHWYSTLFGWYVMTSYLVTAVAIMIILAVYLKKKGYLPKFNGNHLHDLTKYLFGFSLLWGYLWLCQFELIWYANIPEESVYFQQREAQYNWTYYTMLIPNVVLPFVALISSSIKRNYNFVFAIAVIVIIGHWIDIFNQMMPGTVGAQWSFGLVEFGALLLVGGAFMFVVLRQLSKMNLEPKGNPLFHESEVYEYPF